MNDCSTTGTVSLKVSSARPESEVSGATGVVGVLSLALLTVTAAATGMPVSVAIFLLPVGTALPMILWSLFVEKVYRRKSTGLDFSIRRSTAEVRSLTRVKLVGLGATFLLLGLAYFCIKTYAKPEYGIYFLTLALVLPVLLLVAPPYIAWVSRHMVEPKDELWHFGKLICLDLAATDIGKVKDHLRNWAIKGFFLAFMTSILPGLVYGVIHFDTARLVSSPVEVITLLIRAMFLFDVCFGTIGYVLTMRPLDSHIRSPNPFVAGWIAALVCYPPFILMGAGGPLDYRAGTQEWTVWFAAQHGVLLLWGCAILALIFVYAWATVIFGIRFSNLTNRGIITNGPYRYFKHPAYLSKNVAWWLIHVPFLSSLGPAEALQNCMLLLLVNGIYCLRARTEEQHLMADARYRAYAEWIAENGVLERLMSAVRGGWSMVSAALASPDFSNLGGASESCVWESCVATTTFVGPEERPDADRV